MKEKKDNLNETILFLMTSDKEVVFLLSDTKFFNDRTISFDISFDKVI